MQMRWWNKAIYMTTLIVGFQIKDVIAQSQAGIVDSQVAQAVSTSTYINTVRLRIEYKTLFILMGNRKLYILGKMLTQN